MIACVLPVLCGFFVPVVLLFRLALLDVRASLSIATLHDTVQSLALALVASLGICTVAVVLCSGHRLNPKSIAIGRLASLGYAIPGTVLSVGIVVLFGAIDRVLIYFQQEILAMSSMSWLGGTLAGLLFAYLIRFLAVGVTAIDAGFARISPSVDDAARCLGRTRFGVFRSVHLPLLRLPLAGALALVFVEVLKEVPASLILRPFGISTLAIRVYEYASDDRMHRAALPAILLVLVGLIPLFVLRGNQWLPVGMVHRPQDGPKIGPR